jgi:L-ascorbate metabolism protein UlaG (beta-lactamase superfamily)/glycosyltransferase involved in cell wall biosynthesis
MRIAVELLGQSGVRFDNGDCVIYIDPYLSHSVEEIEGAGSKRLSPIWKDPDEIRDANYVLITHEHLDHCDPKTISKISKAASEAKFIGPRPVLELLTAWGIQRHLLIEPSESKWQKLSETVKVLATPSAHPIIDRDESGNSRFIGYLLEIYGKRILHTGDTGLTQDVLDALKRHLPIHTAFLPVNEHNFFREQRGIIGNMSIREAFGLAQELNVKQVIPVHWDMFAVNEVVPEEIQAVYRRMSPDFSLLMRPESINLADVRVSLIIRTLNEARYLNELLHSVALQETDGLGCEVLIVDSGSTDKTLDIAMQHGCRILNISREEFSFGRSLNVGCEAASGDFLVIISGHCVPTHERWLMNLIKALIDGAADYTYGRQLGGERTHFSEKRIFAKYFPAHHCNGQNPYFCNNANSALTRSTWNKFRFNETLTGLEDIELAQRLVKNGGKVAYAPEAPVYHYHEESWAQIQRRFEREAIALKLIMPNIHFGPMDLLHYFVLGVLRDWLVAIKHRVWFKESIDIVKYRWHQYLGVYRGNNEHRKLSRHEKEIYFYPK